MSIPVRAGTYGFTPAVLRDHVPENEDLFVLRHGTRADRHEREFLITSAGLTAFSERQIREETIKELRSERWKSDDQARAITQIEAYWSAVDEFREELADYQDRVKEAQAAVEGDEKPDLPEPPKLDFDDSAKTAIELQLAEVKATASNLAFMDAMNRKYLTQAPRITLRMLLVSTTLDVSLSRSAGIVSKEGCEDVIEALDKFARSKGLSADEADAAIWDLLGEAQNAFRITEEEEKNSSAPVSGSTAPKPSAKPSTSKSAGRSGSKKTSAKASG